MKPNSNFIIIAGQNSVGKTTTYNTLMEEAKTFLLSDNPHLFSDLLFMLNNLKIDDKEGGFNHYHDWSFLKEGGHSHANREPILPFTIISNKIIDAMFHRKLIGCERSPYSQDVFSLF